MLTIIQIIENRVPLRQPLRNWLQSSLPLCQVVDAADEAQAIELARDRAVQAVIIDMDMPHLDGFKAARNIEAAVPGAHIIALGPAENQACRAGARAAGATAYVSKIALHTELIPVLSKLSP